MRLNKKWNQTCIQRIGNVQEKEQTGKVLLPWIQGMTIHPPVWQAYLCWIKLQITIALSFQCRQSLISHLGVLPYAQDIAAHGEVNSRAMTTLY